MSDDATRSAEAMIETLLASLGGEEMAGLSLDDLRDAMSHPLAAKAVAELMPVEAASVKPGEPAPDFTLPFLPGQGRAEGEQLTLSSHFGKRPVALIFGSYT